MLERHHTNKQQRPEPPTATLTWHASKYMNSARSTFFEKNGNDFSVDIVSFPHSLFKHFISVLTLQDTVGSGAQSQPSPQSSPEVNVTCGIQPDIVDDQVVSTPPMLSNSVEEEVDIPEPDEAEVTVSSPVLLVCVAAFFQALFGFLFFYHVWLLLLLHVCMHQCVCVLGGGCCCGWWWWWWWCCCGGSGGGGYVCGVLCV